MPDISADKLVARLSTGKPVTAIVLLGTDSYLREMCRNKIIEACVPEAAREWALARISVQDSGWDEVLQRAQTMPMLANRQVIIVEGVESLEKLGEKTREEIVEALGKVFRISRSVFSPAVRSCDNGSASEIFQIARRTCACSSS